MVSSPGSDPKSVGSSLYASLSEATNSDAEPGRTVKTQTIETSDESASPIEPLTAGGS